MNYSSYILPFLISFILAFLLSLVIRTIAFKFKIVDRPGSPRKIHQKPTPLLGGAAIFLSFVLVVLFYTLFTSRLLGGYLLLKHVWGVIIGGSLLMLGGYLDDRYNLSPKKQIIWPILAILVIIASGIGISYINNPFGGTIYLDTVKIKMLTLGNIPYFFTLWADIFTLIWLLGMVYTTKLLDGLDGLVGGITVIGSLIIFLLSLNKEVGQPETAFLAVILAGAAAGFLILNWHPAKVFLGEGGAVFCGFMLGVLAIISGAKIATTLLIMGIPILDVIWVILRRAFWEKKSPFLTADKKHLHFRLLDIGLSHRQSVVFLYFLAAAFGLTSLFLKTQGKVYALVALSGVMLGLAFILVYKYKKVSLGK